VTVWPTRPSQFGLFSTITFQNLGTPSLGKIYVPGVYFTADSIASPKLSISSLSSDVGPCAVTGYQCEARDETRRVLFGDSVLIRPYMPVHTRGGESSLKSENFCLLLLKEHADSSPPSSPVRKRQRLSSPTYDDQLGDPSQEDLAAYDELDYKLSQSSQSPKRSDRRDPPQQVKAPNLLGDSDNPFDISFAPGETINVLPSVPLGFVTPSALHGEKSYHTRHHEPSPSPEDPPEQDFSAWFEPTTHNPPIGFHSASTSLTSPKAPPLVGFAKASNKGFIVPSSVAFANAREKMQTIWKEVDSENAATTAHPVHAPTPTRDGMENMPFPASTTRSKSSPRRPALQAVENSPGTPSPAPFSRPTPQQNGLMSSTASDLFIKKNSKPFKSPLLVKNTHTSSNSVSSPLNPANRRADIKPPMFSTAGSKNQMGPSMQVSSPFSTPTRPSEAVQRGPLRSKLRVPFTTPFKDGVNSGHMASRRPEDIVGSLQSAHSTPIPQQHRLENHSGVVRLPPKRTGVFDLGKCHLNLLIAC